VIGVQSNRQITHVDKRLFFFASNALYDITQNTQNFTFCISKQVDPANVAT